MAVAAAVGTGDVSKRWPIVYGFGGQSADAVAQRR
jgi:hypothetical protein